MLSTWTSPEDYRQRPVTVVGCGVLGRRIACIWASAGYEVNAYDPDPKSLTEAVSYALDHATVDDQEMNAKASASHVHAFHNLSTAVEDSWLVVEAAPEDLRTKTSLFAIFEERAAPDAVLATNSSSFKSSLLLGKLHYEATKARVLNVHYHMPPDRMVVELMTSGHTAPNLLEFMRLRQKEVGTAPYIVRRESTGFILNRIWASIKREVLEILAEGVSTPQEIDQMWSEVIKSTACGPCKIMDEAGLDTVAAIEQHYSLERGLSTQKTVEYLRNNYLAHGRIGIKGTCGGLYPVPKNYVSPQTPDRDDVMTIAGQSRRHIVVLDIGLGTKTNIHEGEVVIFSSVGSFVRTIARQQYIPDGIDKDPATRRLFWSCMGIPGRPDGAVYSSNYDGSDRQAVLLPGKVNSPKQGFVESATKKLYLADREGQCVCRCNLDGSSFEYLVDNSTLEEDYESMKWCVGVTVSVRLGKVFWTQKGPSKGGRGRIFSADIDLPTGQISTTRTDIHCLLDKLPEPIDLDIDEQNLVLYWTDRGELPLGNSVNCAQLNETGNVVPVPSGGRYRILSRNLNESIGIKLDSTSGLMYYSDNGGSLYCSRIDGSQRVRLVTSERNFTGLTII